MIKNFKKLEKKKTIFSFYRNDFLNEKNFFFNLPKAGVTKIFFWSFTKKAFLGSAPIKAETFVVGKFSEKEAREPIVGFVAPEK